MRTRLSALVAVTLLLAPSAAFAAPQRAEPEARGSVLDTVLQRLAGSVGKLFGASEEDKGPTIDPSGLVTPAPSPSPNRTGGGHIESRRA